MGSRPMKSEEWICGIFVYLAPVAVGLLVDYENKKALKYNALYNTFKAKTANYRRYGLRPRNKNIVAI